MMEAGVRVFKIEGRARPAEYVDTVVRCYKEAVAAVLDGTYGPERVAEWDARLSTVFNRLLGRLLPGAAHGRMECALRVECYRAQGVRRAGRQVFLPSRRGGVPRGGRGGLRQATASLSWGRPPESCASCPLRFTATTALWPMPKRECAWPSPCPPRCAPPTSSTSSSPQGADTTKGFAATSVSEAKPFAVFPDSLFFPIARGRKIFLRVAPCQAYVVADMLALLRWSPSTRAADVGGGDAPAG